MSDYATQGGFTFAPTPRGQTPEDRMPTAKPIPESLFGNALKGKPVATSLDDPDIINQWKRLKSHYLRELQVQGPSREAMAKDEDYYDGDQWEAEDIAILRGRGQEPMVFNVIAQSINWILGTERRGRTEYKILPRTKESAKAAEQKTKLMKYLDHVNMADIHWSNAFASAVKAGVGWMEVSLQDEDDGELISEGAASWRDIIYDSSADAMDLQNGRYEFRTKWVDLDVACALFPKSTDVLRAAADRFDEYGGALDPYGDEAMDSREEVATYSSYATLDDGPSFPRDRLRLVEAWFRCAEPAERIKGGQFAGEIYDPSSAGHVEEVFYGRAEKRSKLTYRMYVMIFCTAGPLWLSKSPYRHNKFPFTPIWASRKGRDGAPYGPIRPMIDAQRDINKRFSKAQFILNSNRVIMEEGAVADEERLAEEVARPDGIITYRKGYHLEVGTDRELSTAHLDLMQISMGMIQSLSGVTDESMGRTTNATSGKAIVARQEQGQLATAFLFDNLRMARLFHGEKKLSLIEQFFSDYRTFRVTNERGVPTWIEINKAEDPESDIVRSKADFILSESSWSASVRQAEVQGLTDIIIQMAPVAPQLALLLLDLLIEAMDIPNREEIVNRVRSITGAEDPDADPENPTPEMQARAQAKAAEAQMAQRAAEANVAKIEGEAALKLSQADKAKADAEKVIRSLPKDTLDNFANALQIAIQMLTAAGAVDTADALIAAANAMPDQQSATPMAGAPVPQGAPMMPPGPQMPAAGGITSPAGPMPV
jgi:hypothetical protein